MNHFTEDTIRIIKSIPEGKVATYGLVARLAGAPRAARQVARTLHALSSKLHLPWHRVINAKGVISLGTTDGKDHQKWLLEQEGVIVSDDYEINLDVYLWSPETQDVDPASNSGNQ